jgi:hypothetical protein
MVAARARFRAGLAITCALPWLGGACGGAGNDPGGDGPGGGPNTGPPVTITLTTSPTPPLVAFRDGVGEGVEWQVPAATAPGTYAFEIRGPYTVAVVCRDTAEGADIFEHARTPDDPRELAIPCSTSAAAPPALHVTGAMTQAAQVALGTAQAVALGDEPQFDLAVDAGTFDLVVKTIAAPGEDELVIRRDQVITRSIMVTPPIDIAAEKLALVEAPYTVTGALPDDTVTVAPRLATRSTTSVLASGRTASTVRILPASAALATDRQSVQAQASRLPAGDVRRFRFRSVERTIAPGGATALALPAALDALELAADGDQLVTRWTTLPEHDTVELVISVFPRASHRKLLTASYLSATRITSATLDIDLPGYKPAWKIDLARSHRRQFIARKGGDDASSLSMAQDDVTAP